MAKTVLLLLCIMKEAFFWLWATVLRIITCNIPQTRLLHWNSEYKQLVCVRVRGGGSLYSCIDWEPVILLQTSPTKDAWKIHTDVLPLLRMCDSPIAIWSHHTPVQHLWFQTDRLWSYIYRQYTCIQSGARGWGKLLYHRYHMVRWCIHNHG